MHVREYLSNFWKFKTSYHEHSDLFGEKTIYVLPKHDGIIYRILLKLILSKIFKIKA